MKFISIVALAVATVGVASAQQDCDVSKFARLFVDVNALQCTSESGFVITAPMMPTGDALNKFCASPSCQKALTTIKELGLGDCTILSKKLETDLLTPLSLACGNTASNSTASNSTVGSNMTSSTPTPAPTSAAASVGVTTASVAVIVALATAFL